MTGPQAQHIVKRFEAIGWKAQARRSDFDQEYCVDASDTWGDEYYTCRRFHSALEVLAILRARASGQSSARADEIMGDFHGF